MSTVSKCEVWQVEIAMHAKVAISYGLYEILCKMFAERLRFLGVFNVFLQVDLEQHRKNAAYIGVNPIVC